MKDTICNHLECRFKPIVDVYEDEENKEVGTVTSFYHGGYCSKHLDFLSNPHPYRLEYKKSN